MSQAENAEEQKSQSKKIKTRRTKACKLCHSLKVKCIPINEEDPLSPCMRCVNSKRVCEIDSLEPKKRRKKASKYDKENVAELKEQIASLQTEINTLRQNGHGPRESSLTGSDRGRPFSPSTLNSESSSPQFLTRSDLERELDCLIDTNSSLKEVTDEIKSLSDLKQKSLQSNQPRDVVSLGIIDLASASKRLDMYRTMLYPYHPFVSVPSDLTVEDLIKSSPLLLNAIMAVTCNIMKDEISPEVSLAIEKQAISEVTLEVMIKGNKTVELVKCLVLMSSWYNTPEFFKTRRFHILNHMAVTLLYDLGLVTRQASGNSGGSRLPKACGPVNEEEYKALILTLYSTTVGFCLILRRAIFVKWTTYVEDCCQSLERSDNVYCKNLALFSRLNRELEKVHHIVHSPEYFMTLPKVSTYTMNELSTQLAVIGKKLNKDNHIVLAYYYSIEAYLFQPSSEDLQLEKPTRVNCTNGLSSRTLHTISQCTSSCLKAMKEVDQMTDEQIIGLPLFHFSRIIYTAGILMRLRYFILSLPSNTEKDLAPYSAVLAIQNLNRRMTAIASVYPSNFLIKKMNLVLRLFVQTYVTQVNDLILNNNDSPKMQQVKHAIASDQQKVNRLAYSLINSTAGQFSDKCNKGGLHLDLLSYAATEFQSTNGESGGEKASSEPPKMSEMMGGTIHSDSGNGYSTPVNNRMRARSGYRDVGVTGGSTNGTASINQVSHGDLIPRENLAKQDLSQISSAYPMEAIPATYTPTQSNHNMYDFDDEFWSNLLTANSDSLHFAQDIPPYGDNVLYDVFN